MLEDRVDAAVQDLERRTLTAVEGKLAKLVYLSSTRDYNTGLYNHQGLMLHFTPEAAQQALQHCHEMVFEHFLYASLQDLVREMEQYAAASGRSAQVLESWQRLQAYRILVPAASDLVSGEFFVSNVKMALAILKARPLEPDAPPAAPNGQQPRLPGR